MRTLDNRDLVFLGFLAVLLVLVLRLVRTVFGEGADGQSISNRIVQDFTLAAGAYVLARLALGLGGVPGMVAAAGVMAAGIAGRWAIRALEGLGGGPVEFVCPDGSKPVDGVLCVGR